MRKIFPVIFLLFFAGLHTSAQAPLKMRDTTIKGPQVFAIILGISKYKYVRPLAYADKDAELFRDYLKSPAGGNVNNDNIFCLLNEIALCSNFWGKGFQWLKAKKLQKGDRLFIYLAGHGDAIDEDQFFFLGYDCNPGGDKNNYLVGGAIQLFNLKKKIAAETAKGVEVVFIMDACRSSELPGGLPGLNFLNTAVSEKRVGEMMMLATGAGQESLEDASIGAGHGLFTYYLVDGLSGNADSVDKADNKITFREIQTYVNRNVPLVAQQQFNRKQEPFFCCNENSEKIVGSVDTAYLSRWLKIKRQYKGPGNSFHGNSLRPVKEKPVDTTLLETYNLFYKAIKENKLTGRASAEDYFMQLDQKFPGNPYTLDAKSTLAVEFINFAQNRINLYLDCNMLPAQKQEFNEAGARLEKAIAILRDDEPDFTNSLTGRMYFLKASGTVNDFSAAFQHAYAAYALDPNAAYINNRLSTLHLENKRADSAAYYARKAVAAAPKWRCAYLTLSDAFRALNLPDSAEYYREKSTAANPETAQISNSEKQKKKKTLHFGVIAGGGISKLKTEFSNWRQGQINYNDSLNSITPKKSSRFEFGFVMRVNLGEALAWQPALVMAYEGGELVYNKKSPTGETLQETIKIPSVSISLPVPLIISFAKGNITPYISAGPRFNYMLSQDADFSQKLPLQTFSVQGDAGIGVDINLTASKVVLSPELCFSTVFTDIKQNANNLYTNTLSSLKKQSFSFRINLRRG